MLSSKYTFHLSPLLIMGSCWYNGRNVSQEIGLPELDQYVVVADHPVLVAGWSVSHWSKKETRCTHA